VSNGGCASLPVNDRQQKARRKRIRREPPKIKCLEDGTPLNGDKSTRKFLKHLLPTLASRCREDCKWGPRPCLKVGCKHHLFLDVNEETGTIKFNYPNKDVWELEETCALDVAERGGVTLEEVGAILNLTRERIRQVQVKGLGKLSNRLIEGLEMRTTRSGEVVVPSIKCSEQESVFDGAATFAVANVGRRIA